MNTFKVSSMEELAKENHDLSRIFKRHYIITPGMKYDLNKTDIEVSFKDFEEPEYISELIEILQICKENNIELRNFFTKGDILLKSFNGREICRELIRFGVKNIDVDMNNNTLTEKELAKLFFYYKINSGNLRLSYHSGLQGLDDFQSILYCISKNAKIGIDNIIFRQGEVSLRDIIPEESESMIYLRTLADRMYVVDVYTLIIDGKKYLAKHYKEHK